MTRTVPRAIVSIGLLTLAHAFPVALHAELVAHWPLDDGSGSTASEVVGGQSGTLLNFPGDASDWVTGVVGGALRFDGIDDFVSHGFQLPRPAGTLVFWARPETASTSILIYESDFPAVPNDYDGFTSAGPVLERHMLWTTDQKFCGVYEDESVDGAGEALDCGGEDTTTLDDWNHVAMTWDVDADLIVYANCEEVGRTSLSGSTFADKASTERFFGRPSDNTRFFRGALDDIRVYDEVLSIDEILSPSEVAAFCPADISQLAIPVLDWRGAAAMILLIAASGVLVFRSRLA